MVFNTVTVGLAITPVVGQTLISHYTNRSPRAQKPTAHISYDSGISLIRKFLLFASQHTVEDIQRFTSQAVLQSPWVKVDSIAIPAEALDNSAYALQKQLGRHGIQSVGGKTWWQWRRPGGEMKADWIEMKSDCQEREKLRDGRGKRIMLYVHGGAYFFGSVDEHRYQIQRHARKLKARAFARIPACLAHNELIYTARYRLAPQFPFPCGLHDCLAAYMYLLTIEDPTTIILAGDSAGGGMIISMLVIMRDQGIPLPAGAILISPWVDLTHSFPSVSENNPLDYLPAHGFHHRVSTSWPPPNASDVLAMKEQIVKGMTQKDASTKQSEIDAVQGFRINHDPPPGAKNGDAARGTIPANGAPAANTMFGAGRELSLMLDGNLVEIKDQIHMYTTNQLISNPLVSPILQPSLGGLPPLLIVTGGGEMLRDEQIYLAHKAAKPQAYPPGDSFLDALPSDRSRDQINRWKGTDVQLQVWDDLCHVTPTLSWTRPAKYMYRSVTQFGAWALARAQMSEIEVMDDDDISVISKSESDSEHDVGKLKPAKEEVGRVGKAGDPLPPFKDHMIRQRVDRHGNIYPLEASTELAACQVSPDDVGVIKEGPVRKWMEARKHWDNKYASLKRKIQKKRAKEMAQGYQSFGDGEVPPPSALAGRRKTGKEFKEEKAKKSYGLGFWAFLGSKHDKVTLDREHEAEKEPETTTATPFDGAGARVLHDAKTDQGKQLDAKARPDFGRRESRHKSVIDERQTESDDIDEDTPSAMLNGKLMDQRADGNTLEPSGHLTSDFQALGHVPTIQVNNPGEIEADLRRPKVGGVAFPFSLKSEGTTASMTTLTSAYGVPPLDDIGIAGVMSPGSAQESGGFNPPSPGVTQMEVSDVQKESRLVDIASAEQSANGNGKTLHAGGRPPLETFSTAREEL